MNTVFLKSRKKGITVAMAATMILIIALMTTTVTIAVVKTVKGSNLKAFATELSLVQNTIQEFAFSGSISEYLSKDVTLTVTGTGQFEGETITNNTVLLHVLDLQKMGIEKSVYGTGKDGSTKDYYAVSLDTMKVYYIAGYDAGDKVYYALTSDLIQVLNGENKAIYANNIVFKANTVEWTNKPVTVEVLVPTRISTSTVTVSTDNSDISVSDAVTSGANNVYTVNAGKIVGNYVITVTYTLDDSEKTETYFVRNFDDEAPVILMGNMLNINNTLYLNDVRALDNGRVKSVKYIEVDVAENEANTFFKTGGIDLTGKRVKLSSGWQNFTLYAEDYAGNYTTSVVTVPDNFYYVGGTKETGLVISDDSADANMGVDYTCVGNQFVWVPVEYTATGVRDSNGLDTGFKLVFKRGAVAETYSNSGIYKMTNSTYKELSEPYANGYENEDEEYYAMCKSVQQYHGFYVARFEAGDGNASEKRSSTSAVGSAVSKKGEFVYNYVPWGGSIDVIGEEGAVYLSQSMYEDNESVVSTLCYGVQWDATMNFVSDIDHNIKSSESWGNYRDTTADTLAAENSGLTNMNYTTGRNEAWKAKNIYDLAGNVWEWTMEAYFDSNETENRVIRGGYCGNSGATYYAAWRSISAPSTSLDRYGFRVALYIKMPGT